MSGGEYPVPNEDSPVDGEHFQISPCFSLTKKNKKKQTDKQKSPTTHHNSQRVVPTQSEMCDFFPFEKNCLFENLFRSQNILKPQSEQHTQNHNRPQNIYFLNYQQFRERGKLVVILSRNSGLFVFLPTK